MSTTTRLFDAIKGIPDPVLAEIVDLAEFLRTKRLNPNPAVSDEPLMALSGGLERSKTLQLIPWPCKLGCAMSGIKYLLDTNFILGLLKSLTTPPKVTLITGSLE